MGCLSKISFRDSLPPATKKVAGAAPCKKPSNMHHKIIKIRHRTAFTQKRAFKIVLRVPFRSLFFFKTDKIQIFILPPMDHHVWGGLVLEGDLRSKHGLKQNFLRIQF